MEKDEVASRIFKSTTRYYKLNELTDKELAEKLMNDVWDKMELFTYKSDLVQVIIDRMSGETIQGEVP